MSSTGEVAAFGADLAEAYWASLTSTNGFRVPHAGSGVLIGGDIACPQLATVAQGLSDLGFKLYCSSPVVEEFLNSLPYLGRVKKIFFPLKDKRKLREVFEEYDIQSVINLAKSRAKDLVDEDYVARRNAVGAFLFHTVLLSPDASEKPPVRGGKQAADADPPPPLPLPLPRPPPWVSLSQTSESRSSAARNSPLCMCRPWHARWRSTRSASRTTTSRGAFLRRSRAGASGSADTRKYCSPARVLQPCSYPLVVDHTFPRRPAVSPSRRGLRSHALPSRSLLLAY